MAAEPGGGILFWHHRVAGRHRPADIARPQAWLEFDVDDVETATRELEEAGYKLLVRNRTEPWGQAVTRLISPEGLLVGVTMTPWMRKD